MKSTIMVVEDNTADSLLLRRAFGKAQVEANIVRAKDGDDAVSYLDGAGEYQDRERYPIPSLILLDIKLPRRSGFEVLSWIRRDLRPLRRVPVVILTSSQHSIDVNRAYELGANAYTIKPDTLAELVGLVDSIKGFWLSSNQFPLLAEIPGTRGAQPGEMRKGQVLLVEDERADASLIIRAFAQAGFPGMIEHAADGDAALHWLDERIARNKPEELPSLVLLDLKLPDISGLELLDEVRRRPELNAVPVVVISGAHDAETINLAYERGANSYLVKSANPAEVNRLILFVKQYWLTFNQSSNRSI
jgi:CheY-like chemotaxis protein